MDHRVLGSRWGVTCRVTLDHGWGPRSCRVSQFLPQLWKVGELVCTLLMSNSEGLGYLPRATQL